jgi:hypothetical protein
MFEWDFVARVGNDGTLAYVIGKIGTLQRTNLQWVLIVRSLEIDLPREQTPDAMMPCHAAGRPDPAFPKSYSALILAALMIGHHFSISDF